MKNITKIILSSFLLITSALGIVSCGKATEKTTIIRESEPNEPGIQFEIQTNGKGVSVETRGK